MQEAVSIWLPLEYAEFVMSLFLTDATRAVSQNSYLITQCLLTITILLSSASFGIGVR